MASPNHDSDLKPITLAETENFMIWMADDGEGETTYNLELGTVTLHMFKEEWEEFLKLIRSVKKG